MCWATARRGTTINCTRLLCVPLVLVVVRVRLSGLESTAAKNEAEDAKLRGAIKAIKCVTQ